ncbi:MAG: hypothetical protein ACRBCT_06325 [Alphaproteobacteria bacterium]
MSLIPPSSPKKVVAVETSVVDLLYPVQHDDAGLKHNFISHLPTLAQQVGFEGIDSAPRKGDMVMVSAEALDQMLVTFSDQMREEGVSSFDGINAAATLSEKADAVRSVLFGDPSMHSGGSLANSFDAMVYSAVNDVPVYDGKFVCMTGADSAGSYFGKSFEGRIATKASGRQMVSHIIPVDGDRIMLTTPSFAESPDQNFDVDLFARTLEEEKPELIMVGGYLHFASPRTLKDVIKVADDYRAAAQQPPTLAFTLANQLIAKETNLPMFRSDAGPLVIHGNTGEFRRFLDMDDEWREPFNHYFRKGKDEELEGRDLELVKNQLVDYQNAKQWANKEAAIKAYKSAQERDVSFVVTNSVRPAFTVNAKGIMERPTPELSVPLKNTVGAGDNFVGGYWVGKVFGRDELLSISTGQDFSRAVIVQDEARLDRLSGFSNAKGRMSGPIAKALELA